ncbi:hypothetical protein GCM10010954_11730 [Halobacillus andaensis]|uniref:Uncharacterized protein n=1 Tax=Halobacillus andaensis TaxID=1176239 RepID=A0A917B230_HALAA|nr:hypothetical protein [Halobacillus andaensis]MBP2003970.1 hypothetical protein [Halobacillus andaensis]GGF14815.1 hypothetical protein GCM10010954_11730 [Halobacillus andaensis]
MDLLPFMKDEGYTEAQFTDLDGKDWSLRFKDIHSNEQLFHHLRILPSSIQYFPLERQPYIYFIEKEKTIKCQLFKV